MNTNRLVYALVTVTGGNADINVDISKCQSTDSFGYNMNAQQVKEFADLNPEARFVVAVRE